MDVQAEIKKYEGKRIIWENLWDDVAKQRVAFGKEVKCSGDAVRQTVKQWIPENDAEWASKNTA